MTPDPLPVALPELEALDKPWRAWLGRINGKFAEVLVYNAEYIQAREARMQAALRAQAEEVAALRALLQQAKPHVEHGATRYYDGTGGFAARSDATQLLRNIDAHLAASKQEKPHG